MKLLFYSNQGLSAPHLAIELEIIDRLIEEGHEIHMISCNNVLNSCYFNPAHNILGCSICEARTIKQYSQFDSKKITKHSLKVFPKSEEINIPDFSSLDALLDFEYDGINIGRGVASSVISIFREPDIINPFYQEIIRQKIKIALNVKTNFEHFIKQIKPDEIYLFNGRFAESHPVLELAKKHKITYHTLEKGTVYGTYDIYTNSLPHSIQTRQKMMDQYWAEADPGQKDEIADNWFRKKFEGNPLNDVDFTGSQQKNLLPENFDPQKENIAIFNSSEDEFKAIPEWQNDLYTDQNNAIFQITQHFKKQSDIHFYIRMHPNLKTLDNTQTRELLALKGDNLTVIPPSSDIDTYKLMFECDKTITFGSRTGVEATFWEKPSILFGKAFHMNLDCVYTPKSFDELAALITQKNLPPKPKSNTHKYAYFLGFRGQKLKHFEWRGKNNSLFKGKLIKRITPLTFWYLLKYMGRIPNWLFFHRLVSGRALNFKDIFKLRDTNKLD